MQSIEGLLPPHASLGDVAHLEIDGPVAFRFLMHASVSTASSRNSSFKSVSEATCRERGQGTRVDRLRVPSYIIHEIDALPLGQKARPES